MKKLIQGIVEFRKKLTEENRELFAKLALGQQPDALFITCSDSRVVPDLLVSTDPGRLFVLRNVGNLAPPSYNCSIDSSASASLEFSVMNLEVSDIIVCGHAECGAMQALLKGVDGEKCPHLAAWLRHGDESLKKFKKGAALDSTLSEHNQLSQVNVLQQMEHILSYPFVQEQIAKKKLRVHGWWFDIARADVYCYENALNKFVLIDEKEAKLIMSRLL